MKSCKLSFLKSQNVKTYWELISSRLRKKVYVNEEYKVIIVESYTMKEIKVFKVNSRQHRSILFETNLSSNRDTDLTTPAKNKE